MNYNKMILTYEDYKSGFYHISPIEFADFALEFENIMYLFMTEKDELLYSGTWLTDDLEYMQFITERLKFKSSKWIAPWWCDGTDKTDKEIKYMWYKVSGSEEIRKKCTLFSLPRSAIVEENTPFEEFKYVFEIVEDIDSFFLHIAVRDKQHFINTVIPKLQAYFPNLVVEGSLNNELR